MKLSLLIKKLKPTNQNNICDAAIKEAHEITINSFVSDRLKQKIKAFNTKGSMSLLEIEKKFRSYCYKR